MIVLVVILLIVLIVCFLIFFFNHQKKVYREFVINNSIAFKNLIEQNKEFTFNNVKQKVLVNTYDNLKMYSNITCADYLIYNLRFIKNEVYENITLSNSNKEKYIEYMSLVNDIKPKGEFKTNIGHKNINKLKEIENTIFYENVKKVKEYNILVTLYLTNINGKRQSRKSNTFSIEQIEIFLERLKNKNGDFYNDSDIWKSICNVERGKVTNKIRFSIYQRDGYRCRMCGATNKESELEIDHIKPIAKGGLSTYNNLQTLCKRCNQIKGDSY